MVPPLNNPTHLRDRAKEMLALADETTDPEEKRTALEIVVGFEKLARLREKQNAA
jgi:hypothetical protein